MRGKKIKIFLILIFCSLLMGFLAEFRIQAKNNRLKFIDITGQKEKRISESWMGLYMNGIKVGYNHNQAVSFIENRKERRKDYNESWMKVSRLGGNPVEIKNVQETLYDDEGKPLNVVIRTKMSESETVIKVDVDKGKILFRMGEKIVKELPYIEEFFIDVPLERIIKEGGLRPGRKYTFKILNPLSYSLNECDFRIIGKEDVLILGKKMNLWHVRSDITSILPITMDEWIDENGNCWISESKASFLSTTAIRMSEEKALEMSGENFDIAFSTVIKSNVLFENPQEIMSMTFKISGIPMKKIRNFPFDESQKMLEINEEYAIMKTSSQIFRSKESIPFPVQDEKFREFLKPTYFCQSCDPEIKKTAMKIVADEKNSWEAAKKIAEWVAEGITPNYDVGFASAKEILKNREGDCSEHTVIAVALCRAAGIPARAAVGIMYAHGFFGYHMWPEVYVGRWVDLDAKWLALDNKSGEYYTDATHIKFDISNLDENIFKDMAETISEVIGKLKIEILDYVQRRDA